MRNFNSRRDARTLVGAFAAALTVALAAAAHPPAEAIAGTSKASHAEHLMALDPGARLGGNTQVVTKQGAEVVGVPRRVNFIIGLDAGQRIVGGTKSDELGMRREPGRIDGGRGGDVIYGGPEHARIKGGPGADLILGGPGRDRIKGGPGSDLIYGGPGRDRIKGGLGEDKVVKGRAGSTALGRAGATEAGAQSDKPVSGDGTNDKPYIAPCDDPSVVDCVVNSFPARQLTGFWANEYVPAYKCPDDHPYMYNHVYVPFGTQVVNGVDVDGLGPIAVSIAGASFIPVTTPNGGHLKQATGTLTGGINSSATSWSLDSNSYRVILHCTSDPNHAFYF